MLQSHTLTRISLTLAACALLLGGAGCDFDEGTGPKQADDTGGEAWTLGDGGADGHQDDTDGQQDDTDAPPIVDSGPVADTEEPKPDTTPALDTDPPSQDSTLLPDTTPPQDTAPSPDTAPQTDGGNQAGSGCKTNSDCTGNLVCCPSRSGTSITGTCKKKSDCRFGDGGFCNSKSECSGSEVCCKFDRVNRKLCTSKQRCPSSGSGKSCSVNPDCPQGEKCCPDFSGNGECRPSCPANGGLCSQKSHCASGEECCDVFGTKVCSSFCP